MVGRKVCECLRARRRGGRLRCCRCFFGVGGVGVLVVRGALVVRVRVLGAGVSDMVALPVAAVRGRGLGDGGLGLGVRRGDLRVRV